MTKKEKIVIIGAGSLQFGLGSVGSIINSDVLQGSTISLHDINQTNLDLMTQSCKEAIEQKKLDFDLESTIDRKKALKNATFIINSIEVGDRFKLWEEDYEIPRKYGSNQFYGENGGPGGLFHSLRVIPPDLFMLIHFSLILGNLENLLSIPRKKIELSELFQQKLRI